MLRRQKTILALLAEVNRPLAPTMLVKLVFLLRRETDFINDPVFYDFVPYKYGPFSFALYRELEGLRRGGFISMDRRGVVLVPQARDATEARRAELPGPARALVARICRRYGHSRQRVLLGHVYKRYPWYAINSELSELKPPLLPKRRLALPAVYTAGYQHKSVDGFFDSLLRAGMRMIVDVRANPVSRKYGFARSSMSGIAEKLGLEYRHLPRLGIPSKERVGLADEASYQRLLDRYEREILPERLPDVVELGRLMQSRPAALVCVEQDARQCHRSRLAVAVAKASGLPINHLG